MRAAGVLLNAADLKSADYTITTSTAENMAPYYKAEELSTAQSRWSQMQHPGRHR
jgi:hypothetical protein